MDLSRSLLEKLYKDENRSVSDIAKELRCSEHKINYWFRKFSIPKRSISEAIYVKNHPHGDPFTIKKKLTKHEEKLLGLGLGLYWGEGNKKNKVSLRLGNTDPRLIKTFMDFLEEICGVARDTITFNLLIFSDISISAAKRFWVAALDIRPEQIRGKVIVLKSGRIGTYRQKSKYGVLILQYHNRKLRDILCKMIEKL